METPLELLIRAQVDGVLLVAVAPGDVETATLATADGSPLPNYLAEGLKRDRFAIVWTAAHLPAIQAMHKTDAAMWLLLLGSGTLKRFIERIRPTTGVVKYTNVAKG